MEVYAVPGSKIDVILVGFKIIPRRKQRIGNDISVPPGKGRPARFDPRSVGNGTRIVEIGQNRTPEQHLHRSPHRQDPPGSAVRQRIGNHLDPLLSQLRGETGLEPFGSPHEIHPGIITNPGLQDRHIQASRITERGRQLDQPGQINLIQADLDIGPFVRIHISGQVHDQRLGIAGKVELRPLLIHDIALPRLLLREKEPEGHPVIERPHLQIDPAGRRSRLRQRNPGGVTEGPCLPHLADNQPVRFVDPLSFDTSQFESISPGSAVEDKTQTGRRDDPEAIAPHFVANLLGRTQQDEPVFPVGRPDLNRSFRTGTIQTNGQQRPYTQPTLHLFSSFFDSNQPYTRRGSSPGPRI